MWLQVTMSIRRLDDAIQAGREMSDNEEGNFI